MEDGVTWRTQLLRELDLIHGKLSDLDKKIDAHSAKMDSLSENVTGLKVKAGFISLIIGAIASFVTSLFK